MYSNVLTQIKPNHSYRFLQLSTNYFNTVKQLLASIDRGIYAAITSVTFS